MEENTGYPEPIEKNRWKKIMNLITLVFFIITIILLAYIVYLYYPLKEQMIRDCYRNVTNIPLVLNITP
jgi:uncharacterized membrane protein YidH (DUF202 family)